ncbi:MAG: hypothetical protein Fur002_16820 [Anaerolineales bacterium]
MPLTLLLDMDDTLLNTNISAFIPAYFQELVKALAPYAPPDALMRGLLAGTNAMNANQDFARTLKEAFEEVFLPIVQTSRETLAPAIEDFYDHTFPTLQRLTSPKPEAKPFIDWARARSIRIAIATDPLLPFKANAQRLQWAGFDPKDFALVSAYENFSFTKSQPAYYAEILGQIGWADGAVLMVGNDMERDILPAQQLGLATYYLNEESPAEENAASGTLDSLPAWIESRLESGALQPAAASREAIVEWLRAAPAALNGLARPLTLSDWQRKTSPEDWSLTELICHLRDTEREVHHIQIQLFQQSGDLFIPRPDSTVWSSERNYAEEDGAAALRQFNQARRETLDMINELPAEAWQRGARHAIFGRTNFLETLRFINDHDRLHARQAWEIRQRSR